MNRVRHYLRRHGLRATVSRAILAARRSLAGNRLVLFYCELPDLPDSPAAVGKGPILFERKRSAADANTADLEQVVGHAQPDAARRLMGERFARGAHLWLARVERGLAGYGWTLEGDTIEPHFFPLTRRDVHLFDFFVFPEFRGRQINPALVMHILETLRKEGKHRAFIEAAEWNAPQLRSLGKLPLKRLGLARQSRRFGKNTVIWSESHAPNEDRQPTSTRE